MKVRQRRHGGRESEGNKVAETEGLEDTGGGGNEATAEAQRWRRAEATADMRRSVETRRYGAGEGERRAETK